MDNFFSQHGLPTKSNGDITVYTLHAPRIIQSFACGELNGHEALSSLVALMGKDPTKFIRFQDVPDGDGKAKTRVDIPGLKVSAEVFGYIFTDKPVATEYGKNLACGILFASLLYSAQEKAAECGYPGNGSARTFFTVSTDAGRGRYEVTGLSSPMLPTKGHYLQPRLLEVGRR